MGLDAEFTPVVNDLIKHVCGMKPHPKTLDTETQRASWLVNMLMYWEEPTPDSTRRGQGDLPSGALPLPYVSFLWLFPSCIL